MTGLDEARGKGTSVEQPESSSVHDSASDRSPKPGNQSQPDQLQGAPNSPTNSYLRAVRAGLKNWKPLNSSETSLLPEPSRWQNSSRFKIWKRINHPSRAIPHSDTESTDFAATTGRRLWALVLTERKRCAVRTKCADKRGAAKPAPKAKRRTGPKVLAAVTPMK